MKLLLPAFLFSTLCFSQAAQQPTEVPVENEPHHHLVFENEYVRVFRVEVPPHQETLVHRHKRDYIVVTIGDASVTNAVVGKEPKKWNFRDGDISVLEASGENTFAHKAVNESDTPFVNYTIELKKGAGKKICTNCAWSYAYLHENCGTKESGPRDVGMTNDGPQHIFENFMIWNHSFCANQKENAGAPMLIFSMSNTKPIALAQLLSKPDTKRSEEISKNAKPQPLMLWRDEGQEYWAGDGGFGAVGMKALIFGDCHKWKWCGENSFAPMSGPDSR